MKNYTKGECTLDAIVLVKFLKNGARMNWCQYLLTEMFQCCADVHNPTTYFIYGYLLISFECGNGSRRRGGILLAQLMPRLPSCLIYGMPSPFLPILMCTMSLLHNGMKT
jgi:hypothetical protein